MKFKFSISFEVKRSGQRALDRELVKLGLVELEAPDEAEEEPSEEKPVPFGFAK